MAKAKKNQILQFMTPFVDKTDGLSIESGVTSGFTQRLFGAKHGVSTAVVAKTPSKTLSVVRSGIFRVTLKSTEVSDFDQIIWQGTHASCADQLWEFGLLDNDDSDLMSMLTLIQSLASDAHSAATQANSRVLLNQSRISDAYSMLSDFYSDFQSRVPKAVATNSQLSDLHSDLRSFLVVMSGIESDILSSLSDLQSDFQSRVPKRVATDSQLSDLASDLRSYLVGISATLSDVDSALTSSFSDLLSLLTVTGVQLNASTMSDLRSAIAGGPAATVTASDISDIASAVWAFATRKVTSNIGLNASDMSDIRSAIAAGPAATVTASDISDIASAVWANVIGARVDSRILLNQSRISDAYSMLSDFYSDFQSRVPKAVATNSQLSDLASDLRSYLVVMSGVQSDIYSALSDLQSDFQSRVPKRVATDSQLSDLHSDLKSYLGVMSGVQSDIYSLLSDVSSDLGVMSGVLSDTYSGVSDLASKFGARVPATFAELTAVPSATPTLGEAQMLVFQWLRNNTKATSSKRFLRNAAGTTIASATIADDGTSFVQGTLA